MNSASSSSRPASAASSAHSSPHAYHHQLAYTALDSHVPSTSLHISTASALTHDREPGEETAHPFRAPELHGGEHDESGTQSEDEPMPSIADAMTLGPGPHGGLTRPLTHQERELINHLDRLKFFLATAPSRWSADGPGDPHMLPIGHPSSAHPALNRFLLPNQEYVSCVLWGGLYHITGTDIVRALVFRFEAFGRPVRNMKKFEEGVFSDLRNLKPGVDACLEEPKSPFLDLLFKYQCIRTQKKQKVFYWFSVPHDRLFLDALERDLKREKMGLEPTTIVVGEPALSFTYDPKRSLYEQFSKAQTGEGELEAAVRLAESTDSDGDTADGAASSQKAADSDLSADEAGDDGARAAQGVPKKLPSALQGPNSPFFSMFSLFEGSPTYKQRRKKAHKNAARRSPSAYGYGAGPFAPGPGEPPHIDEFGRVHGGGGVRAPEPHVDRFGRDTSRMSAAEMFVAQARGDFGAQSNPDLIASQKERQRRAMEVVASSAGRHGQPPYANGLVGPGAAAGNMSAQSQYPVHPSLVLQGGHPMGVPSPAASPMPSVPNVYQPQMQDPTRPFMQSRHTLPAAAFPQAHMRTNTLPYADNAAVFSEGWPEAGSVVQEQPALPRSKAFVCPLFSCGRMFKRMEHLKRHLRTHTLERPYQCEHCKKRFSRSDNLNQHYRTHGRAAPADQGAADGEQDVDELEGDDAALDYIGDVASMANVQMYEVEVQGQVQEIQGDEEGLVMATSAMAPPMPTAMDTLPDDAQEPYYAEQLSQLVGGSPEQNAFGATNNSPPQTQWAGVRPQSSMSYTATSVAAHQMRLSPSYGDYATSLSAPSHKATFDHGALYPADLDMGGPGPIRRHRSVTPSVKYGEAIRRPFSAAISDHGAGRSYHPYAVPGHHHAHSAESSPMAYSVPLGYGAPQQAQAMTVPASRAHSRSSSSGQLQEQMSQMLNIEHMGAEQQQQQVYARDAAYSTAYRADSPMQYATAASYELVDVLAAEGAHQQLPQYGLYGMAQPQMDSYSMPGLDSDSYSALIHNDAHPVHM